MCACFQNELSFVGNEKKILLSNCDKVNYYIQNRICDIQSMPFCHFYVQPDGRQVSQSRNETKQQQT